MERRDDNAGGGVPPGRAGPLSALALAAWLLALDAWVKFAARRGACDGDHDNPWSEPVRCVRVALLGDGDDGPGALPAVREGLLGIGIADPLLRQLLALAGLAAITVLTIVTLRARTAQRADLLAIAVTFAGLLCGAAPILFGPGVAFTEFVVGDTRVAFGDLLVLVGVAWIVWGRVAARR
jgi:hypothetical protein